MIKEIQYKGYKIEVDYDPDPEDPREFCDHDTVIYSNHREFNPDGHDIDEIIDENGKLSDDFVKNNVYMLIYGYSHSGISISTERCYPYIDPWDGGTFGIIAIRKSELFQWHGYFSVEDLNDDDIYEAKKYMSSQIAILDDYYNGAVYCYTIYNPSGEQESSVGGFYGGFEELEKEAKSEVDFFVEAEEAWACEFWSGENVA